jgi:glycosyltransferase involved in cell wall biosynthesis
MGVAWEVLLPTDRPWNPFRNPTFRGIDPWRVLKVLIRHRRADAIVSVFESNALLLLLLRRLFLFRPKVLLWDASTGSDWRALKWIQRFVIPRFDGFLMLITEQQVALKSFQPRGLIRVIGYNIDETFYRPASDATEEYILAVGDDISRDYPTMLEAVAAVQRPVIIKSSWRPSDLSSVPTNVRFLSERLSTEELRRLYAGARIVIVPLQPTKHAGGITALFEAMAMGKPTVVTACPMSQDFVIDGVHALVVPPDDAIAMEAAIRKLDNEPMTRALLSGQARATIERERSTRTLAEKLRNALGEMTGRTV